MKFTVTKEELNTFILKQHTLGADTRVEFIELLKTPIVLDGEPIEENQIEEIKWQDAPDDLFVVELKNKVNEIIKEICK